MAYQFRKPKRLHRYHIEVAVEHKEHKKVGHAHVDVKVRAKWLRCDPVRDAAFCDDLSYIPYRYIRGTIRNPKGV